MLLLVVFMVFPMFMGGYVVRADNLNGQYIKFVYVRFLNEPTSMYGNHYSMRVAMQPHISGVDNWAENKGFPDDAFVYNGYSYEWKESVQAFLNWYYANPQSVKGKIYCLDGAYRLGFTLFYADHKGLFKYDSFQGIIFMNKWVRLMPGDQWIFWKMTYENLRNTFRRIMSAGLGFFDGNKQNCWVPYCVLKGSFDPNLCNDYCYFCEFWGKPAVLDKYWR